MLRKPPEQEVFLCLKFLYAEIIFEYFEFNGRINPLLIEKFASYNVFIINEHQPGGEHEYFSHSELHRKKNL